MASWHRCVYFVKLTLLDGKVIEMGGVAMAMVQGGAKNDRASKRVTEGQIGLHKAIHIW